MPEITIPAGKWHGYYAYAFELDARQPTQLAFELRDRQLKGRGQDDGGKYEVAGAIEPDGRVHWTKRYDAKGAVAIAYVGTWDAAQQEIAGRWRAVNTEMHGRFALRPGELRTEGSPRRKPNVDELLETITRKRQPLCRVDLEALRFDGEREMLASLLADRDYVEALRKTSVTMSLEDPDVDPAAANPQMRVRLDRAILPHVFSALDRAVEAIGLRAAVHLYCANDGTINAWVEPARREDEIRITFTSGAINALDEDELTYVLGHEIGHALLGHLETRVISEAELSGVVQLRRLALGRYQELSADRMGLVCCPDIDKALRAELMLHSGVTLRDKIGSSDAIVRAADEAVRRMSVAPESVDDAWAGYDTHPHGPLRTLAIHWFARSSTFRTLRGANEIAGSISEQDLEAKVRGLVEVMNPTALEGPAARPDVVEFLALAGLSVAQATSGASKQEIAAIRRLRKPIAAALDRAEKMSTEEQQVRIIELTEQLVLALPLAKRTRLVEDLTLIAEVDGRVSEAEADALRSLAFLLQTDEGLPMQVLGELTTPQH